MGLYDKVHLFMSTNPACAAHSILNAMAPVERHQARLARKVTSVEFQFKIQYLLIHVKG